MPLMLKGKDGKPEEVWRCPRRPFLDEPGFMRTCLSAYSYFKDGMLMYDGGVVGQPVKLMQAINVLAATINEAREDRQASDRRKQVHKGRAREALKPKGPAPKRPTPAR